MRTFFCTLLLLALTSVACSASQANAEHAAPTRQLATVIRTPVELQHYLHATAHESSPLDALSPGARKRFLAGLIFGRGGLGGFSTADLGEELDRSQIRAILSLLDADSYAAGIETAAKPLRGRTPPTAVDRDYTAFFTAMEKDHGGDARTRAAHARRLYQDDIAGHSRSGLSPHDLSLLYRAALQLAFLDPNNPLYLQDARKDLDALAGHGRATAARATRLHNSLIAARRFSVANQLAADFPAAALTRLPTFTDTTVPHFTGPSVLLIDSAAKAMVRKPIDLDTGEHIVIIAGCHFSEDAADAVEAHPEIARVLRRHGLWLADQGESVNDVAVWNKHHPHQLMNVAWADRQWQRITSWAMPTFYVFKQGKLIDQWNGWPADTGLATLRQHLQANGFLEPGKKLVPQPNPTKP